MNRVRRVRHERYFIVKRLSLVAKVSPSELLRMTQILALGIPLDDVVMENLRASPWAYPFAKPEPCWKIRFST